jgi:hypothetical protein
LNQPMAFQVRFVERNGSLVSDRAFNGMNLARAYLDDPTKSDQTSVVQAIKIDSKNPNRQITLLKGDRQLVSTITQRAIATPSPGQFLTSELFQQEFRSNGQIYFNLVENTTAYSHPPTAEGTRETITADQITAIYLSSQDPDYFKAGDRPVALYRYRMQLTLN